MRVARRALLGALLALAGTLPAAAHVGSKDVFESVHAGPYTLFVTVRPPDVVPGVAIVEIRGYGVPPTTLRITPLPITGEAAKHPPAADIMSRSTADPLFFTGAVWMMSTGTWQVRIEADGPGGAGIATVPVVAVPIRTLTMSPAMVVGLGLLGVFLIVSMAGIVWASMGEARQAPGRVPAVSTSRRGALPLATSVVLMLLAVLAGGWWWHVEAASYASNIFRPARTSATLAGSTLDLHVEAVAADSPLRRRANADYLADHGELMHLYAIREPEMDAVFHLHPKLAAPGDFRLDLPAMPPGTYKLYGDVVHATGLPETLTTTVDVPAGLPGGPLSVEDASAAPPPLSAGVLGPAYRLPDGYTLVWDQPPSLTATTGYLLHFHLLDPAGQPAIGMQPYLGMAGHAAFVKTDGTVFAHTHPEGSAAMPDVMLANASMDRGPAMRMEGAVGPEVSFPYGFPSAGRYRIFVQMKHRGVVETGVFDAVVAPAPPPSGSR